MWLLDSSRLGDIGKATPLHLLTSCIFAKMAAWMDVIKCRRKEIRPTHFDLWATLSRGEVI